MRFRLRVLATLLVIGACTAPVRSESALVDSAAGLVSRSGDPEDSTVAAATAMLAEGRPWAAYRALAPALRDSARRTPGVVLAAARAAAAWGGWEHVRELLREAPWSDSADHGAAHMLLARAALAAGDDSMAAVHATFAVDRASGSLEYGERLLLQARALDRLDKREPSRAAYLAASRELPQIADWLRLRAAALTADSAGRATIYAQISQPASRARIALTEAQARERSEDFAGAAREYERLGARDDALRARALYAMRDSGSRDSLEAALLQVIRARPGSGEARVAAELQDQWFAPHSAPDELAIARALSRSGPLGRAAEGFARAADGGLLTDEDRFAYGRTLARLNRDRAAAAQYARVKSPPALAAAAAYQRGRALVALGELADARRVLRSILADSPRDTSAGLALFLLADLATDERRDDAARDAYREGADRFPALSRTPRARFLSALIAFTNGDYATAAREWDDLAADDPKGPESTAAQYWSGRAWYRAGQRDRGRDRWRDILKNEPTSYYAFASAEKLGEDEWTPFAGARATETPTTRHPVLARALRLESLDLDLEARLEFEHLSSLARGSDSLTILEVARQLVAADRPYLAIPLAAGVASRAAGSNRVDAYRALYPAPLADVILRESRKHGIDPALFAALVRQESWYNPRATSGAGARGLAQVMPRTGQAVARSLRFPHWDAALLYEPEASVTLGAAHLASSLSRYDHEARALAAYNAGQSRVERWNRKRGTDDIEVFIERIPFVETRDYVRIVLRNRELYRALYPSLRPA